MAAISLFWNTNMAAVTSWCENALYPTEYAKISDLFKEDGENVYQVYRPILLLGVPDKPMGHFRVAVCLCFEVSLGAQLL